MAFNVSYIFQARDQFSAVARKVKRQTKDLRTKFKGLGAQLQRTGTKFKDLGAQLRRTKTKLKDFGAQTLRSKTKLKDLGSLLLRTGTKFKGLGARLQRIKTKFKGLRTQLSRTNTAFKKTSSTMSSGFRQVAATAAVFFGAREFIRVGSEFQTSMADLSAITGAVGDDFDLLKSKTLALSKASITSQAEVAQGIKLVASAKPELLENLSLLIKTTEQILLLKNASGLDLATAAKVGAESLNIFGRNAKFASEFVNILAAGSKFGSSEIADTGAAVLIAGGAARNAGLTFLQLNAAIQTVAVAGFKGSQSGTALSAILGRLQRKGIDFQKLGLEGSFMVVKKAMDAQTDSTMRAQFASALFGEEHAKVGFGLLNNVKMLGKFEAILGNTNVAQEQASIRLATFSAKARGLGIAIKDKLIQVFLRLAPTFEKIVKSITDSLDSITPAQLEKFSDGLKTFVVVSAKAVSEFSKSLMPVIKEFFGVIRSNPITNFVSDLSIIGTAAKALAIPFIIIGALIKGVTVAVASLVHVIRGDFEKAFSVGIIDALSIGGKFLGIFTADLSALAPILELISNLARLIAVVVRFLVGIIVKLGKIVLVALAPILKILMIIIKIVMTVINAIATAIIKLGQFLGIFKDTKKISPEVLPPAALKIASPEALPPMAVKTIPPEALPLMAVKTIPPEALPPMALKIVPPEVTVSPVALKIVPPEALAPGALKTVAPAALQRAPLKSAALKTTLQEAQVVKIMPLEALPPMAVKTVPLEALPPLAVKTMPPETLPPEALKALALLLETSPVALKTIPSEALPPQAVKTIPLEALPPGALKTAPLAMLPPDVMKIVPQAALPPVALKTVPPEALPPMVVKIVAPEVMVPTVSSELMVPEGKAALSKAEIDVNITAPDGVVESVKTKRKGDLSTMNLGVNMRGAA